MPCECGHPLHEHVDLHGYPGGCEECQADGCDCGRYRAADGATRVFASLSEPELNTVFNIYRESRE